MTYVLMGTLNPHSLTHPLPEVTTLLSYTSLLTPDIFLLPRQTNLLPWWLWSYFPKITPG